MDFPNLIVKILVQVRKNYRNENRFVERTDWFISIYTRIHTTNRELRVREVLEAERCDVSSKAHLPLNILLKHLS